MQYICQSIVWKNESSHDMNGEHCAWLVEGNETLFVICCKIWFHFKIDVQNQNSKTEEGLPWR